MAHIMDTRAMIPNGWECPKCRAVYAPWMFSCLTCAATPGPPAPAEACCACGSAEVTYRNYREQPFCRPCANREQPRGLYPVHIDGMTCDPPCATACGEPGDGPVLHLPQFMSRDGYEAAHVAAEWAEVFPGLQCRVRHFIYEGDAVGAGSRSPDAARLDFRLTPPDGQARD